MRFGWLAALAAACGVGSAAQGAVLLSGDAGSFTYFEVPPAPPFENLQEYSFNYDLAKVDPTSALPMIFDLSIVGSYRYTYYDAALGGISGNEDSLVLYCSLGDGPSLCELPGDGIVPRVALTVEKIREGQINFSVYIGDPYAAPCVEDFVICGFGAGGVVGLDVGFNQDTPVPFTITSPPLPVPEPTAWAMMIGGFGIAGGALRWRRRSVQRLPDGRYHAPHIRKEPRA